MEYLFYSEYIVIRDADVCDPNTLSPLYDLSSVIDELCHYPTHVLSAPIDNTNLVVVSSHPVNFPQCVGGARTGRLNAANNAL